MKKKILTLCTPIGLLIYVIFQVTNRFIIEIPDPIAYLMMIISILLLIVGIAYNGYRLRKHKA